MDARSVLHVVESLDLAWRVKRERVWLDLLRLVPFAETVVDADAGTLIGRAVNHDSGHEDLTRRHIGQNKIHRVVKKLKISIKCNVLLLPSAACE